VKAAVCIESVSVSRRHARIVVSKGTATLEDLGSKNGTFLRGRRIELPVFLTDDDEFFLGRVPVRLRAFSLDLPTQSDTET
jgi:pSer/pThr/pTyr-binding forkhead associated (FHA) protein